jgi:hypothetical protein
MVQQLQQQQPPPQPYKPTHSPFPLPRLIFHPLTVRSRRPFTRTIRTDNNNNNEDDDDDDDGINDGKQASKTTEFTPNDDRLREGGRGG